MNVSSTCSFLHSQVYTLENKWPLTILV
jgi:hypothetical protein